MTVSRIDYNSDTTLQDLPWEMLDFILMKALHFTERDWVRKKQYLSDDALLRFLVRLQSVSTVWENHLGTDWFRKVFKRRRLSVKSALSSSPVFVSREEWSAREPTSRSALCQPVPLVVLLETVFQPGECCLDEQSCTEAVQYKQNYYMDVKGWADVPYNFMVGEDGRVYEGRGWKVHGAHTSNYNDSSIGIGFIGLFETRPPSDSALRATHELIRFGVKEGHIAPDYSLYGHRDLRATSLSPGKCLYEIIKGWPNYRSSEI